MTGHRGRKTALPSMNLRAAAVAAITLLAVVAVVSSEAAQQPTPVRSVWDGVFSEEQAQRGKALYAQRCVSCHGLELGGGEMAPPLTGGAFTSGWDGLTLMDLSERIRVSMPQDDPGKLSRQ